MAEKTQLMCDADAALDFFHAVRRLGPADTAPIPSAAVQRWLDALYQWQVAEGRADPNGIKNVVAESAAFCDYLAHAARPH